MGTTAAAASRKIFAAHLYPGRVRSLTLNQSADTHDNWPLEAFKPFLAMAAAGGLRDTLEAMLADKAIYRSPQALGPAYEDVGAFSDADIDIYLRPLMATEQQLEDSRRFRERAFDNRHTLSYRRPAGKTQRPRRLGSAWANRDDVYFPVRMGPAGWPGPFRGQSERWN